MLRKSFPGHWLPLFLSLYVFSLLKPETKEFMNATIFRKLNGWFWYRLGIPNDPLSLLAFQGTRQTTSSDEGEWAPSIIRQAEVSLKGQPAATAGPGWPHGPGVGGHTNAGCNLAVGCLPTEHNSLYKHPCNIYSMQAGCPVVAVWVKLLPWDNSCSRLTNE